MIKRLVSVTACAILMLSVSSCVHLKEYQKSRLNDSEMALGNRLA